MQWKQNKMTPQTLNDHEVEAILYAIRKTEKCGHIFLVTEAGSRARGLASESSDYDVRFVYMPTMDWYCGLDRKTARDVFDAHDKAALGLSLADRYDVSGMEITKFLGLVLRSNPTVLEWLSGDVYQTGTIGEELMQLKDAPHNAQLLSYHYDRMARNQVKNDRLLQETRTIKDWLMFLVPALSALWVDAHGTLPPMKFDELVDSFTFGTEPKSLGTTINEIREVAYLKRLGHGNDLCSNRQFSGLRVFAREFMASRPPATITNSEPSDRLRTAIDLVLYRATYRP